MTYEIGPDRTITIDNKNNDNHYEYINWTTYQNLQYCYH